MSILNRLFKLALLNILREFDSAKYKWYSNNNHKQSSSENFYYYYKKYKEYYQKYHGNSNYNSKYDYYGNRNKFHSSMSEKKRKIAQYYANLEIPFGSSLETVKASWKRLLKKYHPDLHQDEEKIKKATILTQKLNEAYFEIEKYLKENNI